MKTKRKNSNETIVRHFYNLPKVKETPENYREVTLIMPTMTIHLVSSYQKENIKYLSTKAIQILEYLKQEGN